MLKVFSLACMIAFVLFGIIAIISHVYEKHEIVDITEVIILF